MDNGGIKMKIVFISDTHTAHREVTLPKGDVLVFAGDFSLSHLGADTTELLQQARDFDNWLGEQDFEKKICISGNHEKIFEKGVLTKLNNAIYLENESYTYKGITFFGSPWTPHFYGAFNTSEEKLKEMYKGIRDIDVFISHGPPYGVLDKPYKNGHAGSRALMEAIGRIKPIVHVFGHIHDSYGEEKNEHTHFFNASMAGESHKKMKNAPWVFDIQA